MKGPGRALQISTDGNLVDGDFSGVIYAMTLSSGGAAAQVDLLEGGVGGTVRWTLKVAVNEDSESIDFPNGLAVNVPYLDLSGADAVVSVEFN